MRGKSAEVKSRAVLVVRVAHMHVAASCVPLRLLPGTEIEHACGLVVSQTQDVGMTVSSPVSVRGSKDWCVCPVPSSDMAHLEKFRSLPHPEN